MDISIVRPLMALRDSLPRNALLAAAAPGQPTAAGQTTNTVLIDSPQGPNFAALTTAAASADATTAAFQIALTGSSIILAAALLIAAAVVLPATRTTTERTAR